MYFDQKSYPAYTHAGHLNKITETDDERILIKNFADSSHKQGNLLTSYMVTSNGSFNIALLYKLPARKDEAFLRIFTADEFFLHKTSVSQIWDDGILPLYQRTLSQAMYLSFFALNLKKLNLSFPENDLIAGLTRENCFIHAGDLKNYLPDTSEQENYKDASFYSLDSNTFFRRATALIRLQDNYLVLKTTSDFVFALEVLRKENTEEGRAVVSGSYINKDLLTVADKNGHAYPKKPYAYLNKAGKQIQEYLDGLRQDFDLELEYGIGSDFQKQVWEETLRIPYGQTVSYNHIADRISKGKKEQPGNFLSRAVGTALSKNPIMIIVPCHRVIGKDGKLRGFGGGVDVKDYLLTLELTNYLS